MLVLTRRSGQKLIISNNIEVTILETRGDSVKLGISAPKDIAIYREEIYEEIRNTNRLSMETSHSNSQLDNASQLIAKPVHKSSDVSYKKF